MNIGRGSVKVNTFYVLDFDRCLGRTERLQELLENAVETEDFVSLDMIQYAHTQVKKTGGSFDTAAYVRQVLKDRQLDVNRIWGKIETSFLTLASGEDLLELYARELLDELTNRQLPFGILTYGGYEWQTAKLKAAGLYTIPHIITSYKEKGKTIAGWQRQDGWFLIPREFLNDTVTRTVVLIDDKPVSFQSLPPSTKGICVAPQAPAQEIAALPSSVTVVPDLKKAIDIIATIDKP